jgi:uncharacterized protein YcsI (UPF0317 family)
MKNTTDPPRVGEPDMLEEMRTAAPRIAIYVDWRQEFMTLAGRASQEGPVLKAVSGGGPQNSSCGQTIGNERARAQDSLNYRQVVDSGLARTIVNCVDEMTDRTAAP